MSDELKDRFAPLLQKLERNEIMLSLNGAEELSAGASKFGGEPDLPSDHKWPYYKEKPLSFLAQIDLAEASEYDTEGLLPKSGTLSFFYECDEQPWGYDPKHAGGARVYYFPEGTELVRTPVPDDMPEYLKLSEYSMIFSSRSGYPDLSELDEYAADISTAVPVYSDDEEDELWDSYMEWTERDSAENTKLLGYAELVQNPMRDECEKVAVRSIYTGNNEYRKDLTDKDNENIEKNKHDWILLFQLGDDIAESIGTMFGDCGNIYFWIRKQDLTEHRFDKVWCILQCG
ncbi:MAG: YwqG family protein [Ruminococcus flavefaciens]